MKTPAAELDEAAQEWIDCYDATKSSLLLHRSCSALLLPDGMARGRGLPEAFESYRQVLLASERSFNHLEVVELHPNCGFDTE